MYSHFSPCSAAHAVAFCHTRGRSTTSALPPPLSPEEESELLSRLPEDGAKSALIEHNLRLVVYIARKFENTSVGIEDLISIGTIGLIKAVGTFCPDRGIKLATYASRCIENEILMFIRKSGNRRCLQVMSHIPSSFFNVLSRTNSCFHYNKHICLRQNKLSVFSKFFPCFLK